MSRLKSDCLVWGALALTLQVSRLLGIAPIRMAKENGKWRISVSPVLCVYSYLVMFALHICLLTGLAMDLSLDSEIAIRVRTPTSRAIWIVELIIVLSISTTGVIGSPARMREMIQYLNIIEKVQIKSNNDRTKPPYEKTKYIAAIVCLVAVNLQHSADFYNYISQAIHEGRELKVVCIYLCFYIEFLILVLLEMQFLFLALQVYTALKLVNDTLNDLIYIVDLQSLCTLVPEELNTLSTIPAKPVNILIDNLKVINDKYNKHDVNTIKSAQEKVRCLILSYGAICDVIRQVNTSYGRVLLLLVGSFFLHLVVSPYYLVAFMFSPSKRTINLLLQFLYVVLHTTLLVIAVEPGHQTEREIERTSMLVSQLLRRVTSPRDTLALELDLFYKHIVLNKVSYSPLGMCTLARPLIAAICGGVTTYLVIIFQFQALDK